MPLTVLQDFKEKWLLIKRVSYIRSMHGIKGYLPLIKKGWLQHFLSSIIVLSRDGMLLPLPPDLVRKVKFFSKMAL